MSRAVAYVRQSVTRDAESLSLETQAAIIRRLAEQRGIPIAGEFADPDRRGWDEERPGLAAALARCEQGDITHFMLHDVSRLARSVRLLEQYVHRLSQLGIELVSHSEPWAGSPMYRQILGAVAEEGTRIISANWRRVLAGRAARGLSHGVTPYGFKRTAKGGPIEPDRQTCEIVCELFAEYSEGRNIADLAADLTRRGVPAPRGGAWWTTQTVAQILDNPVYAGIVLLNGERHDGAHEAIVDAALFAAVEDRRAGASRPFRKKPCSSWLEGHIYHACGAKMHLQCAGGHPGERPRFRCWRLSHRHTPEGYCRLRPGQIAAYLAEPIVLARIAADLADLLPVREVLARARDEQRRRAPGAIDLRRRLDADAARLAESRRRAEDLYLSGVRDRGWFDTQEAANGSESARILRELAGLPATPEPDDIRAHGAGLRGIRRLVAGPRPGQMAPILAELGIVVVGADGVRVLYREAIGRHLGTGGETAENFLRGCQ